METRGKVVTGPSTHRAGLRAGAPFLGSTVHSRQARSPQVSPDDVLRANAHSGAGPVRLLREVPDPGRKRPMLGWRRVAHRRDARPPPPKETGGRSVHRTVSLSHSGGDPTGSESPRPKSEGTSRRWPGGDCHARAGIKRRQRAHSGASRPHPYRRSTYRTRSHPSHSAVDHHCGVVSRGSRCHSLALALKGLAAMILSHVPC